MLNKKRKKDCTDTEDLPFELKLTESQGFFFLLSLFFFKCGFIRANLPNCKLLQVQFDKNMLTIYFNFLPYCVIIATFPPPPTS